MGTAGCILRAELRRSWRSWLLVVLLLGVAGGAAIAAASGARRTTTAYPRMLEATGRAELSTGGARGNEREFAAGIEELKRLPTVEGWYLSYLAAQEVITETGRHLRFPDLVASVDVAHEGPTGPGVQIIDGRQAAAERADEATVSFAAEADDLTIGSRVTIPVLNARQRGEPTVVPVEVRIVGIHAAIGEFPSVNGIAFPAVRLTPAFFDDHRALLESQPPSDVVSLALRLEHGPEDVAVTLDEIARRDIKVDMPFITSEHVAGVQRTMRLEAWGLWFLCVLCALVGAAIGSVAITRQILGDPVGSATLSALGLTRSSFIAIGVLRAVVLACVASGCAVALGLLGTHLVPVGLARIAEPDPGIRVDGPVLAFGALAVAVGVVLFSLPGVLRLAFAHPERSAASSDRRVAAVGRAVGRLPVALATGVRFALQRGSGRPAAPTRSGLAGIAVGVGALVAAIVFTLSAQHATTDRSTSGFEWDLLAAGPGADELVELIGADADAEAVTRGGVSSVQLGDERMTVLVTEPESGIDPVVIEGRRPSDAGEIALGSTTIDDLDVSIGEEVPVRLADAPGSTAMRLVGRIVVPGLFFEVLEPGVGASITYDGFRGLGGKDADMASVLVRYRPGVDVHEKAETLREIAFVHVPGTSAEVATLTRLSELPVALAVVVALLAAASLVHALAATVRRRRRELAILGVLGLDRSQMRASVLIQALTLTLLGLALGVPLGLAVGRWGWRRFADEIAILPVPTASVGAVATVAVGTVAFALLASVLPARAASRVRAAEYLRAG